MRQDDLDEYLDREPFQPFRVHLSTGAFFDIHQPQLAYTSRSTLALGLPIEGDKQRFLTIALVHIVWIEVLVPAP
jgi:hypothetical protein